MPINASSSIDDLGPEFKLDWPPEIFKTEVLAMIREEKEAELGLLARPLLTEAFEDEAAARELDQLERSSPWGVPSWDTETKVMTRVEYLGFLVNNADALHKRIMGSPYWLDRKGITPTAAEIEIQRPLQVGWVSLVQDLIANGYFSKLAPTPCVDDDSDSVDANEKLDLQVQRKLKVSGLWQRALNETLADDYLYALMEVFHDLVSRPRLKSLHEYGNCGWHFDKHVKTTGQKVYRWRVNELLTEYRTELKLDSSGENLGRLVKTVEDPRANIAEFVGAAADPGSTATTEHAIALFERRGASREDKRSACVALARVLEDRRKLIQKQMLKGDESLLFDMANNFDLRHRNAKQKVDYADDYLDWIFWIYLSTVELTNRMIERQ